MRPFKNKKRLGNAVGYTCRRGSCARPHPCVARLEVNISPLAVPSKPKARCGAGSLEPRGGRLLKTSCAGRASGRSAAARSPERDLAVPKCSPFRPTPPHRPTGGEVCAEAGFLLRRAAALLGAVTAFRRVWFVSGGLPRSSSRACLSRPSTLRPHLLLEEIEIAKQQARGIWGVAWRGPPCHAMPVGHISVGQIGLPI